MTVVRASIFDARNAQHHATEAVPIWDTDRGWGPLVELRRFEINQAEFAKRVGVSQGQLSAYENGTSEIGAEALLRIFREFGKSIEWI